MGLVLVYSSGARCSSGIPVPDATQNSRVILPIYTRVVLPTMGMALAHKSLDLHFTGDTSERCYTLPLSEVALSGSHVAKQDR